MPSTPIPPSPSEPDVDALTGEGTGAAENPEEPTEAQDSASAGPTEADPAPDETSPETSESMNEPMVHADDAVAEAGSELLSVPEAGPDSGDSMPLSTRDIEQIIVSEGGSASADEEEDEGNASTDPAATEPEPLSVPEPAPDSGDAMSEPLSTRDIEQIVVPQSYYDFPSDGQSPDIASEDQIAALKPVDFASLVTPLPPVPVDSLEGLPPATSDLGGGDVMPLSSRDLEDITDYAAAKESPGRSDEVLGGAEDPAAVVHPLTVRRSAPPPAPQPPPAKPLPPPQPPPLSKPPPRRPVTSQPPPLPKPPPLPRPSELPGMSGPPIVPMAMPPVHEELTERLGRAMLRQLAAGDYEGAFIAANALLRTDPRSTDALQAAQIARSELYKTYDHRLGDRRAVPHVVVRTEDLRLFPIDACCALVLSQIDGVRTIDEIIHSGILPKLDALRVLSELHLQGIVDVKAETKQRF